MAVGTGRRAGATRNSPLTGIAYKVGAVLIFLVMSALLKASNGIPAGQLVFFRSFFGLFPVVIFLAVQGELREGVTTKALGGHIWRGLVGTVSMALGFFALTRLPLPEAVTINYAMPLIIVILSAIVLREAVHLHRWSAVVIGLVGVIIIAWPRLTLLSGGADAGAGIGVIAALCAATMGAVAQLLVRRLTLTERSGTIVFYFLLTSSVISLVSVPFGWQWPTGLQAVYLVGAGFAGGIAQVLMTESYRHAELSVVAPFEYSSLVFSVIIGFVFFGDVPTWFMLVGGVIVVGSGLFIIYRERRLGLDRKRVEEVVTPQG
jgi:drug/metabolite transporter (DMT)-like permease